MHSIEMHEVSPEFAECWRAAGRHLNAKTQDGIQTWLKAELSPPFLEHLSFRLGNQLFFIRLEDVDQRLETPGNLQGLLSIADGCKGHGCLMPMKQRRSGGWAPIEPGWGLIDARTEAPIDPVSLITDEKIEMTPWELHDFAVQIVRKQIEKEGYELMSWQGNPSVDPAIWFVGDSGGPEWVVVRATRYPKKDAEVPGNSANIANNCARLSKIGHFASVAFASVEETFESSNAASVPLWRGHGVHVSYTGLSRIPNVGESRANRSDENNRRTNDSLTAQEILEQVEAALQSTNLPSACDGDTLTIKYPQYETQVDMVCPKYQETEKAPIEAVFLVRTKLPHELAAMCSAPTLNAMASLGALTMDGDEIFIGSRLTVYEAEDAANIQCPLLISAVIDGAASLLGAIRRSFSDEYGEASKSEWTQHDFSQVESYLSKISVCNSGSSGLTAEFGLKKDAVSAVLGDSDTRYNRIWCTDGN